MTVIELRSLRWRTRVAPCWGGALLSLEHEVLGTWQPVLRPFCGAGQPTTPNELACYPLVPWSNRIGNGAFTLDGKRYTVARNVAGEDFPIHGHGWLAGWKIRDRSAASVTLTSVHEAPGPFSYEATLVYRLDEAGLHCELGVRNLGARMPFGLGLHPFFPRTPHVTLHAATGGMWLAGDDRLPFEHIRPTPSAWAFDTPRVLPDTLIDHAFSGWTGHAEIAWPERGLCVRVDADVDHLVIYTPPGRDFFCVEPVDHPINALNLPEPVRGGLTVLPPGGQLQHTFHITAL